MPICRGASSSSSASLGHGGCSGEFDGRRGGEPAERRPVGGHRPKRRLQVRRALAPTRTPRAVWPRGALEEGGFSHFGRACASRSASCVARRYIILELSLGGETKQVVRGNGEAEFHADIYDKETTALKKQKPGIKIEVRGGGRIRHEPAEKRVFVYGCEPPPRHSSPSAAHPRSSPPARVPHPPSRMPATRCPSGAPNTPRPRSSSARSSRTTCP